MGTIIDAKELIAMRTRHQELIQTKQIDPARQATRDVLRLLDYVAALEAENAKLLEYHEDVMAWGRALDEGWRED